jgi:hypothetical protein
VKATASSANKALQPGAKKAHKPELENKAEPEHWRVPTGQVDAEARVRVIREESAPPVLAVRTFRRSPSEVRADAFRPTAAAVTVQLQYAELLAEQILAAAGKARAA